MDSIIAHYDSLQYDTLQTYPYLYVFNWPDTTKNHDGMACTLYDDNNYCPPSFTNNAATGILAVYQHTDVPLTIYGIACTSMGGWNKLYIYDSAMNIIINDTTGYTKPPYHSEMPGFWSNNVDTSRYKIFTVPGKRASVFTPLTEKIVLYFKYFTKPIEVTGSFWIGICTYNQLCTYCKPYFVIEEHEEPYRINNVRTRIYDRGNDVWAEDTLTGHIPELFAIVAPPCPEVTGLSAVMDSLGNVDVTWDSADRQIQWVVEMHGPGVSVMDTVSECRYHYPGLYPSMAYAVKVHARCLGPDNNIWSDWTSPVQFGNTAIDAVEYEPLTVTMSPNPAKDNVTVAAEGYDDAVTVSVTSISGVEHIRREKVTLPLTLDTKGLAAGVYMVRVSTAKGTATRRLMVQ